MNCPTRIFDYDKDRYGLASIVARHLGVEDLSRIQQSLEKQYAVFRRDNDQSSEFHRRFYSIGSDFYERYREFVRNVVAPLQREVFIFQRIPTFRVHLPDNVAVGEYHRDRDYSHSPHEINYWLPMTNAWDTNTIWVESAENREDYRPCALRYGQVLQFDGANLKHGNQINRTGSSRVSFDFRILPLSRYSPSERSSINTKMRFVIGEYFDRL